MDGDLCSHLSLKERKKIRKKKNVKRNLSMRKMIREKSTVFSPCKY